MSICCLPETHLRSKDRLKVKGWKKIHHREISISGSTCIRQNRFQDKESNRQEHYLMVKGSVQQDITIITIYALFSHKKETNPAIFSNMDGAGGHYAQ